jgi:hypothetical protein
MNRHVDCLFTVTLPARLEEEFIDLLLARPEWVDGFSLTHPEGFGGGTRLASAMERVRGRARRATVTVAMDARHVEPLLQELRAAFPTPEIAWWTMPVSAFGRFA